jgi:hypothetical protein
MGHHILYGYIDVHIHAKYIMRRGGGIDPTKS